MIKLLHACLILVLMVGAVAGQWIASGSNQSVDLGAALAQENFVKQRLAERQQFLIVFDSTLNALADGELTLNTACLRVQRAAQLYSPTYLKVVPIAEGGATLHESIARNLLGHLRDRVARSRNRSSSPGNSFART